MPGRARRSRRLYEICLRLFFALLVIGFCAEGRMQCRMGGKSKQERENKNTKKKEAFLPARRRIYICVCCCYYTVLPPSGVNPSGLHLIEKYNWLQSLGQRYHFQTRTGASLHTHTHNIYMYIRRTRNRHFSLSLSLPSRIILHAYIAIAP